MTNYEVLEIECKALKSTVTRIWSMLGNPSYEELAGRSIFDMIAELQKKAQSADDVVKDAERYRWLRSQPIADYHGIGWQIRRHWKDGSEKDRGVPYALSTMCLSGESLDIVIDRAMQANEENP